MKSNIFDDFLKQLSIDLQGCASFQLNDISNIRIFTNKSYFIDVNIIYYNKLFNSSFNLLYIILSIII